MKRLLLLLALCGLPAAPALAIVPCEPYQAPPQPTAPQIMRQRPGELHPIMPIVSGTYHRVGRLWWALFGPRTW